MTTRPFLISECRDPDVAVKHAHRLVYLAFLDSGEAQDQLWARKAAEWLACLLHAAALTPGATLATVRDWACTYRTEEAERTLADHGKADWAMELGQAGRTSADSSVATVMLGVAAAVTKVTGES